MSCVGMQGGIGRFVVVSVSVVIHVLFFVLLSVALSEKSRLHDAVASFGLALGNVDALRHEVVCRCRQGAAMGELFYAVESVFGHLVRGYEYGLCLPLTPLIESFVVETFCLVIYVGVFVWNIAIYHAVFGYRDFLVVKHRGRDR